MLGHPWAECAVDFCSSGRSSHDVSGSCDSENDVIDRRHSGSSALNPKGDELAVYNVVDGVDVYAIRSGGGIKRKPRRVFKHPRMPRTKHALQTTFIIDGRGLVCGTTTGDVCVWDTANGDIYQVLNHDKDDVIQAVAVGGRFLFVTSLPTNLVGGKSYRVQLHRYRLGGQGSIDVHQDLEGEVL